MKSLIVFTAMLALAAAGASAQQMYKWVDKDGKVTFSDQPPPKDAKNVEQKKIAEPAAPLAGDDDMPFSLRSAMQRNPVVLYANDCGEGCTGARALLTTRGVPFTDRNPEKDSKALADLKDATGAQEVPVLMVGTRVISGFRESEWNEALSAAGYPRFNVNATRTRSPAAPAPAVPAPVTPEPAAKAAPTKAPAYPR